MDWLSLKHEAARMLFEKDALHIYAALVIQITAAKLSSRSPGHALPWVWVLGMELANEVVDILRGQEPKLMPWQIVSGVHDILNTMILPTALLLLCRCAPELFQWKRSVVSPSALQQGDPVAPGDQTPSYQAN